MQNLRDKLLQAGLVDKKKKKQADHQLRQQRARDRKDSREKMSGGELAQKTEQQQEERRRKERERQLAENERRRREEQQRRQEEEKLAAERLRRSEEAWQKLKARSLLEASLFLPQFPGPVRFYFIARSGGIRRLQISTRLAAELSAGLLAICQLPAWGEERFGLVRRDTAQTLLQMDPALVRFFVRDQRQELVDLPPAVTDSPPRRLGPPRVWRFSPRSEGDTDRRL